MFRGEGSQLSGWGTGCGCVTALGKCVGDKGGKGESSDDASHFDIRVLCERGVWIAGSV